VIDSFEPEPAHAQRRLTRGIVEVLDTAESFVEVNRRHKEGPCAERTRRASLFFEESTRTRLSFETAASDSQRRALARSRFEQREEG